MLVRKWNGCEVSLKILVCVKQVPVPSSDLEISETNDSVKIEGLAYEANENDLYAVEEALYQKSLHGGEVTVVSVGPSSSRDILFLAYAKGVDRAIHIFDEKFRGNNLQFNYSSIASFVRSNNERYDMIFTGIRADDDLQGQFGGYLSESLSIPMITSISQLVVGENMATATVQREIANGYIQEIEVDLPCLLSIQFGIRPLQYTSINQLIKAKLKKIQTINSNQPSDEMSRTTYSVVLSHPQRGNQCEIIEAPLHNLSAELVTRLRARR